MDYVIGKVSHPRFLALHGRYLMQGGISVIFSNSQYGLFFATENTEIHGKITKKDQNGFFFVFEFFRVFLCNPWLKNISL